MVVHFDLEALLKRLHDCEMECWIGTAAPAHAMACIVAPGGREIRAKFELARHGWLSEAITNWLVETACVFFPDSVSRLTEPYARRAPRIAPAALS